jgi:hypothetical protein
VRGRRTGRLDHAADSQCHDAAWTAFDAAATACYPPQFDTIVFATANGIPLDAHDMRRSFGSVLDAAGLNPTALAPRDLRKSLTGNTRSSTQGRPQVETPMGRQELNLRALDP